MARIWEVGREEGRLEQARIELPHRLRGTHGGEIRDALVPPLRAQGAAESEQTERDCEQHADDGEHHQ